MITPGQVRELLEKRGLRLTRQRLCVIEALFSSPPQHLTAEQLHQSLRSAGEQVSLSRVYGTLNMLCAEGLMRRLPFYSATAWFEPAFASHQHYYLEEDGQLVDMPDSGAVLRIMPEVPDGYELVGIDILCRIRRRTQEPVA